MDSTYQERLATMEAEWEEFEKLYTEMKAKRAALLRERPCDFYLEYNGKVWIQYRDRTGQLSGSYGWSQVDPSHRAVWTSQTRKGAKSYAQFLQALKGIIGIEVKDRPIT